MSFVVFKGKWQSWQNPCSAGGMYSKNGWMEECLTKDWISQAWGLLNFNPRRVVWDAYRCHIMDSVICHAKKSANNDTGVNPGGLISPTFPTSQSILE